MTSAANIRLNAFYRAACWARSRRTASALVPEAWGYHYATAFQEEVKPLPSPLGLQEMQAAVFNPAHPA